MDRSDFTKLAIIAAGTYFSQLQQGRRMIPMRQERLPIADVDSNNDEHIEFVLSDFAEWLHSEWGRQ